MSLSFRCPVCNQILGMLVPSHVRKHGYESVQDFIKDYPEIAFYRQNYANPKTYKKQEGSNEQSRKTKS